ncbi:MAG TPA: efflux RND transporter periplasmic adaptor subunit [Syntrophales bacterium]|nr:efflux RND transporter periplasmic adaptor subunit [Syntrophales bacterium]HQK78306.1 efflux RND transporter periplasmic adaptor subunit [Syntrophales bacterium]
MKKRVVLAVFVALLVAVGGYVYYGQWKNKHRETYYSGVIEAKDAKLAFQAGGRVIAVHAREGQAVTKEEVLAELDAAEFQSRCDQARAALARAVKGQEQAETSLQVYQKVLPADVIRAEAAVTSARRVMEEARRNKDRYDKLYQRKVVAEKEWDAVRLHYDTSVSRLAEGKAALSQAVSNLKKIDIARREIEAATAQVRLARASMEQAEIQAAYTKLRAPFAGVITSRNVEPGEVVSPSREVFNLADLSRVDLKIFVEETAIGKVRPGQAVEVKIDTFPNHVFPGVVSFVSPEGEFTPKIIQTQKERVKLVYLVKVSIPNPDLALKTGMPADAWLK